MLAVTKGMTHLAHALHERLVSHDHVRPYRLDQLVLGHEASRICDQVPEDLETPRAQFDLAVRGSEASANDIERVALKPENLRRRRVHRRSRPGPKWHDFRSFEVF